MPRGQQIFCIILALLCLRYICLNKSRVPSGLIRILAVIVNSALKLKLQSCAGRLCWCVGTHNFWDKRTINVIVCLQSHFKKKLFCTRIEIWQLTAVKLILFNVYVSYLSLYPPMLAETMAPNGPLTALWRDNLYLLHLYSTGFFELKFYTSLFLPH